MFSVAVTMLAFGVAVAEGLNVQAAMGGRSPQESLIAPVNEPCGVSVSVNVPGCPAVTFERIGAEGSVKSLTWKLWLTGGAAAKLVLPACVAWMVQVPAATRVTFATDTVQTAEVVEAKLRARLGDAVALSVNGALPNDRFESAPKLMVWLSWVTWKLWLTGGAAAKLVLPACVAWMVQVPAATRVTFATDTVQTAEVVEAKLRARPEDAVALSVNG